MTSVHGEGDPPLGLIVTTTPPLYTHAPPFINIHTHTPVLMEGEKKGLYIVTHTHTHTHTSPPLFSFSTRE